jgi:hypothetical protein
MKTAKRYPRTKNLNRYILPSDDHEFIGRVYDLGIVAYHFDSYEALARHDDCKYAYEVGDWLRALSRRGESLNLVGDMLWPESMPKNFKDFPVSRYDWLTITADVFLMRYISVVDCCLLLINSIYELDLKSRDCVIKKMEGLIPKKILEIISDMMRDQGYLRGERNRRFHHGQEREFTEDDQVFRTASLFEHRGSGLKGKGQDGRRINVERSFKEGLVELQRDFNVTNRQLVRRLNQLYNDLYAEFESRFGPKISAATHGLNAGARHKD